MGFQNPPDYQDNQGFCGGREYQIEQGGKCGICGDPWLANPKDHEAPGGKYLINWYLSKNSHDFSINVDFFDIGKYANGIITNTYEEGQEVEVRIQITANHLGYFQFKLCANNDVSADKDQSCFDKWVLVFLKIKSNNIAPPTLSQSTPRKKGREGGGGARNMYLHGSLKFVKFLWLLNGHPNSKYF